MKKFQLKELLKRCLILVLLFPLFLASCDSEEDDDTIIAGDYPVKEYYLERDPKVNPWGAGMDFIHSECALDETELDVEYLTETSDFAYDIKYYIVKSYYVSSAGDTTLEGTPAMLLNPSVSACEIGVGVTFFDECTEVTSDMISNLTTEPELDYSTFIDESGSYSRELIFAAYESCVIGQSFRGNVLEIPDDSTEEESQPVYLVKTQEGGYVKFMVKQFKGDEPYQKQTLVRWQVISE